MFNIFLCKLVKIGKKLKKEKVNVDVVNFGEEVSVILSWNYLFIINKFTY